MKYEYVIDIIWCFFLQEISYGVVCKYLDQKNLLEKERFAICTSYFNFFNL